VTAHRRPAIPFSDAPRGTCRWCGEAILYASGPHAGEPNRRRRWHPQCVDEYNASDPREARRLVRKRDRTVCAKCGTDTNALRRRLRDQVARAAAKRAAGDGRQRSAATKKRASTRGLTKALREQGFKPRQSLWELDHIVPLIDGGDHGLANLQTLCTPCHKEKTVREARERAERRSEERWQLDAQADAQIDAHIDAQVEAQADSKPRRAADLRSTAATDRRPSRGTAHDDAEFDALLDAAGRLNSRVEHVLGRVRGGGPLSQAPGSAIR
jgi:5-methylcytosine-specific restriction endonuclease McrA